MEKRWLGSVGLILILVLLVFAVGYSSGNSITGYQFFNKIFRTAPAREVPLAPVCRGSINVLNIGDSLDFETVRADGTVTLLDTDSATDPDAALFSVGRVTNNIDAGDTERIGIADIHLLGVTDERAAFVICGYYECNGRTITLRRGETDVLAGNLTLIDVDGDSALLSVSGSARSVDEGERVSLIGGVYSIDLFVNSIIDLENDRQDRVLLTHCAESCSL